MLDKLHATACHKAGMSRNKQILVVGCGFAGATIARVLAENGYSVDVIDKRNHIGGNAYDLIHSNGERLHHYGPHLLHGKQDSDAVRFLSRFTEWVPYEHRVRALLPDGRTTPLPVNRTTLEDIFGVELEEDCEAEALLEDKCLSIKEPANTDDFFLSSVGEELTNLFFRPYSQKMWGRHPRELAASVGARLPVRYNRDDRYFLDDFQALPKRGYTALFESMLNHPDIKLQLSTSFEEEMLANYAHSFLSIPIDVFFDCRYGALPYRSIQFEHRFKDIEPSAAVINFTDTGPHTRMTAWGLLPNSSKTKGSLHLVTYERPCTMEENPGEYYYPVINKQSNKLLSRYQHLAQQRPELTFCGRTGLFRYLDMLPAVTLHLQIAKDFIRKD